MIGRTALSVGLLAAVSWAQPRVTHAQLETRASQGDPDTQIRSLAAGTDPIWAGYAVPAVPGERNFCCHGKSGSGSSGCALEPAPNSEPVQRSGLGPAMRLEPAREIFVLFRAQAGNITEIRVFSPDCELDAAGTRLYWLTGVTPDSSLAALDRLARAEATTQRETGRIWDSAVFAIAMHGNSGADILLEKYAAADQPETLRRKAVFWLGMSRGSRGYAVLERLLREDKSSRIREAVIHALAESREPTAIQKVIDAARSDADPKVRGTALFWLAQKAGKQAVGPIEAAIANDPEQRVKEHALFALTQLPQGEGVPLLMNIARNNHNPALRKKAMFWLGQSKDARAVQFFEEILAR